MAEGTNYQNFLSNIKIRKISTSLNKKLNNRQDKLELIFTIELTADWNQSTGS